MKRQSFEKGDKGEKSLAVSQVQSEKESLAETVENKEVFNLPKDQHGSDETVKNFVIKWQELCEDFGYEGILKIDFFRAKHPFANPIFPIKIMDPEKYMLSHYTSIKEWKNHPKPPIKFLVIELREQSVIAGIHLSGPIIEFSFFQAFIGICIYTRTLTVLRLIGCSLKKESIIFLGEYLPRTFVTHLYLDRNPLPDEDYSSLLANNTALVHLSLSMCNIGLKGIKFLSKVLGTYEGMEPNQCLKSLILDNNRIDNFALRPFSECLRWNRDLVLISLAGNIIGNQGIQYLSNIFYCSELTKKELYLMNCRQIDRLKELENIINEELRLPIEEVSDFGEEDPCGEEGSCNVNIPVCSIGLDMLDPIRMSIIQQTCDEFLEIDPNPLSYDIFLRNGKLMGTGNYTLNSLNLSYNKIEETGFAHLLKVIRDQKSWDTVEGISRKNCYLKIIEFQGNPCPEDSRVLKKISFHLKAIRKTGNLDDARNFSSMLRSIDTNTMLPHDVRADYFDPAESTTEDELDECETYFIDGDEGCDEMLEERDEYSIHEIETEEEFSEDSNDDSDELETTSEEFSDDS